MAVHPHIVIIGGGFTGTALAIHLGRQGRLAGDVTVIEPRAMLGCGVAYSTRDPAHRINVPADKMQLSAAEEGDFDRWCRAGDELPRDPEALWRDGSLYPQRGAFGRYIAERFSETAAASRLNLHHLRDRAISLQPVPGGAIVTTAGGVRIHADATVLAISHPPPALPSQISKEVGQHPALIANPWQDNALAAIGTRDELVIIGTGLTMADVAASLQLRGHRGQITAFSRRGLLPRPNVTGDYPSWPVEPPLAAPETVRRWLRRIRRTVVAAADAGVPWQKVIDDVRANGQTLWQRLPPVEQRRFLRHLRPYWDVHRYRIAPQVSALLRQRRDNGTLRVLAARLDKIAGGEKDLTLQLALRQGGAERVVAQKVIISTGPAHGSLINSLPLLRALAGQGLIVADPLGLGLWVNADSQAIGSDGLADPRLLVAGPAARGRFGELIGLPQVAEHAQALATQLLALLTSPALDGRCPLCRR
ncbi:FAD/NAD(P)-binding protein [Sodalis ligni]|uniref:FAD/NAD(P)-binding protein n=1 Tax=Sodalis ligni TaxID=2697027 RepID=UPI00193ED63E|nr:FAD/NAD(P)-binding protein [Sodalis ligni]QWA13972.1 FAD/NAD(P)-binding protein [Sodalis ligni]